MTNRIREEIYDLLPVLWEHKFPHKESKVLLALHSFPAGEPVSREGLYGRMLELWGACDLECLVAAVESFHELGYVEPAGAPRHVFLSWKGLLALDPHPGERREWSNDLAEARTARGEACREAERREKEEAAKFQAWEEARR